MKFGQCMDVGVYKTMEFIFNLKKKVNQFKLFGFFNIKKQEKLFVSKLRFYLSN